MDSRKLKSRFHNTHVVCSHHYYLAVHTFEEGLGESVFDLGEVGEIDDVIWLPKEKEYTAHLKVTANNFPNYSKLSEGLIKQHQKYELTINLESMTIKPLK